MLYIRADANPDIATGHIMRCISIANEFRKHGEDTTFIIADEYPCEILEHEKYNYICLNTEWNDLDIETELMVKFIKENNISKLLIDTYYVTEYYLNQLSLYTKIIYIDDLASFIYPVCMLVNYNNYYDTKHYLDDYWGKQTKLLLGCKYAPLRDEFFGVSHEFRDTVKKVLVTTGGTDNFNIAGKLLEFLCNSCQDMNKLEYHVIVGKFNFNIKHLEQLTERHKNIIIHYEVKKMSEIMLQCDIAVTAGGSTMYELCACAIPMITYSFADNQIDGAIGFERLGVAKYCGDVRNQEQRLLENIYDTIVEYRNNNLYRWNITEKMKLLVDGKGSSRLYYEMNSL